MCVTLGPSGRLPRHTELMRRLGASERIVLKALDELQRQGRIVRRHGSGTFVTDIATRGAASYAASVAPVLSKSIVAIARPDRSIFDRCMELLYEESCASDVVVTCRLLGPEQAATVDIRSFGDPTGFIVFRRDLAPLAKQLYESGRRVVLVGAPEPNQVFGVPCVCGNQEHGGYLVTKHLAELGHRRIAFAHADGDFTKQARWQGCLKMMRESERLGSPLSFEMLNQDTMAQWAVDPSLVQEFIARSDAPTAIACWNDRVALDLLSTLGRARISVPDQISVVGYDNLEEGARMHPALTTVDHLIEQQVATAVELLTGTTAPDANRTIVYAPTVVQRETTSSPRFVRAMD